MIQNIKAPITTYLVYDHRKNVSYPAKVIWDGKDYKVKKVGLHYKYRVGNTLMHTYTVCTEDLFFKIALNTETLSWTLEQISDGLPD